MHPFSLIRSASKKYREYSGSTRGSSQEKRMMPGKWESFEAIRAKPKEILGEVNTSGPHLHLQALWFREDFSGH
jgi:hypothetical protein